MTGRHVVIAVALAIAAAGCGDDSGTDKSDGGAQLFVETIDVNGREVECVVYNSAPDDGAVHCEFNPPPLPPTSNPR